MEWEKEFDSMSIVIFLNAFSPTREGIKRIKKFIQTKLDEKDEQIQALEDDIEWYVQQDVGESW